MLETHTDLWMHHREPGHLVCISVNGFVKRNGCAVMGRGCALEATHIHPGIAKQLGESIRKNGNVPGILIAKMLAVLPVKHNWWEKASMDLIRESVAWLRDEASIWNWTAIHVPRLGCGNGQRDWAKEVRPLMLGLPDNVLVHS